MGFLLIPIFVVYLLVAFICIAATIKFCRSKLVIFAVVLFFALLPFRRLIFYKILFTSYARSPLQEIHKTVEKPMSVYWEDNVWPGFDAYGRNWMVKNYLDGDHLEMLALNGEDGKVYLYRANQNTFVESNKLKPEFLKTKQALEALRKEAVSVGQSGGDNEAMHEKYWEKKDVFIKTIFKQYETQRDTEVAAILDRVEIYANKSDLPPMRYHVEFNLLPKSYLLNNQREILHADRINITEVESGIEIAFSIRYMAYSWTRSKFLWGSASTPPPSFDYKLGDIWAYEFDNKVLFEYAPNDECHSSSFNNRR